MPCDAIGKQCTVYYWLGLLIECTRQLSDAMILSISFAGKANYYGIHVVQKKKVLRVAVVSKQLTLYDQKTTDQYVVDYKVLTV